MVKSYQLFPVCLNSRLEIVLCHDGNRNRGDYLRRVIEASNLLELASLETTTPNLIGFQPAIWSFPANRPEEEEQNDPGRVLPHDPSPNPNWNAS